MAWTWFVSFSVSRYYTRVALIKNNLDVVTELGQEVSGFQPFGSE